MQAGRRSSEECWQPSGKMRFSLVPGGDWANKLRFTKNQMSEHKATIVWKKVTEQFTYETYNRSHVWRFDAGIELKASATPAYLGNADMVDPEEAFVASLSSCHMLTFLAFACKKRLVVESYEDEAVAHVEKTPEGKMAITRVVLRPLVKFSAEKTPTPQELEQLHHSAHEFCFIANSVKASVAVEPR